TVRDAQTGEHVRDLDSVVNGTATFSPDGKWLVVGTSSDFRFRETGTWALGPVLRRPQGGGSIGAAASSPDGRLVALTSSRHPVPGHAVHLAAASPVQELAVLQPQQPMFATHPCCSPDGSRLAAATEGQGTQSGDLRRIRQQLAEIGLDWDLPPYPPARPSAG